MAFFFSPDGQNPSDMESAEESEDDSSFDENYDTAPTSPMEDNDDNGLNDGFPTFEDFPTFGDDPSFAINNSSDLQQAKTASTSPAVTAPTSSTGLSDVEKRLQQARLMHMKNTNETREAVINGASNEELDRLAIERAKLSNTIKEPTALIEGGRRENKKMMQTVPPEVIILDDDDDSDSNQSGLPTKSSENQIDLSQGYGNSKNKKGVNKINGNHLMEETTADNAPEFKIVTNDETHPISIAINANAIVN